MEMHLLPWTGGQPGLSISLLVVVVCFFLCIALLFSLIVFCLFLLCSVLLRFVCFMFDVVYVMFF